MNHMNVPSAEDISSLVDGFLVAHERAQVVHDLLANPQAQQLWHRYHVVGDVLRSAELAPGGDAHAFWDRLSRQLEQEPQRPGVTPQGPLAIHFPEGPVLPVMVSANAGVWRWKLLAGLGSVVFATVVVVALRAQGSATEGAQMAVVTAPAPVLEAVDSRNGVMLRDPQLDQLMAAHQQVGGHSALQLPTGFLRNATFEGPAR